MATSDPIELATEIMVAFVANNAVPRADLPALFQGLHSALKRLADGGEVAPAAIDPPAPAVSIRKSVTPDYLICLDDGETIQISAAAPGDARHDAGAVPREMESAIDLSNGRAQLRGATIGICEEHRVWAAREARRRPAGERSRDRGCHRHDRGDCAGAGSVSVIEMVAAKSATVDTIEVATVEPTSGAKRKAKAKAKSKVVAAPPAVPVKRKPGRPRKATA